eukprot:4231649-Pyramimonas_sp.AAC.1
MCSGSTWDSVHRVRIERRAWPGWRPVQPLVSRDGARSLPGLVIPEDALHAPAIYPLWDDERTYNSPGGTRFDPEHVRSHQMDTREARRTGVRQPD